MRHLSRRGLFVATAGLAVAPSLARAAPRIGVLPPDFTGADSNN